MDDTILFLLFFIPFLGISIGILLLSKMIIKIAEMIKLTGELNIKLSETTDNHLIDIFKRLEKIEDKINLK